MHFIIYLNNKVAEYHWDFPESSAGKGSSLQFRKHRRYSFDLWVGKIRWKTNGNAFQYSCRKNPMDTGADQEPKEENYSGAWTSIFHWWKCLLVLKSAAESLGSSFDIHGRLYDPNINRWHAKLTMGRIPGDFYHRFYWDSKIPMQ